MQRCTHVYLTVYTVYLIRMIQDFVCLVLLVNFCSKLPMAKHINGSKVTWRCSLSCLKVSILRLIVVNRFMVCLLSRRPMSLPPSVLEPAVLVNSFYNL